MTPDAATVIGNRRAFEGWMADHGQRQDLRRGLAVLIFDIDHFKAINDRYGHGFGDKVIAKAAEVARHSLREQDEVFRIGGEEFACVLSGVTEQGARASGERLRAAFERDVRRVEGIAVAATISVGIAMSPGPSGDPEVLLVEANAALYEVKRAGRNRIAFGSPADR